MHVSNRPSSSTLTRPAREPSKGTLQVEGALPAADAADRLQFLTDSNLPTVGEHCVHNTLLFCVYVNRIYTVKIPDAPLAG